MFSLYRRHPSSTSTSDNGEGDDGQCEDHEGNDGDDGDNSLCTTSTNILSPPSSDNFFFLRWTCPTLRSFPLTPSSTGKIKCDYSNEDLNGSRLLWLAQSFEQPSYRYFIINRIFPRWIPYAYFYD